MMLFFPRENLLFALLDKELLIFFLSLYWICYNIPYILYFGVFLAKRHMDLNSSTRDWTSTPCIGKQSLNHRATRDVQEVIKYLWLRQRLSSKESAYNARDTGDAVSIPESGRSLEEEMATHSSILAWRVPWTEEPGGLQFMRGHKVSDMTKHACTLDTLK